MGLKGKAAKHSLRKKMPQSVVANQELFVSLPDVPLSSNHVKNKSSNELSTNMYSKFTQEYSTAHQAFQRHNNNLQAEQTESSQAIEASDLVSYQTTERPARRKQK